MVVVGIDPGTVKMGFAAVEGKNLLDFGVIKPRSPRMTYKTRVMDMFPQLVEVLDAYQPDWVVVEAQYVHQSPKTAIQLGVAKGMVLAAATAFRPSSPALTEEVEATAWKKEVVGRGNAGKEEVAAWVVSSFGLAPPPPQDACDAICIALWGARHAAQQP